MSEERLGPPEPRLLCGNPSDDWMVKCGIVPASASVCGPCKKEYTNKLLDGMYENIAQHMKKKVNYFQAGTQPGTGTFQLGRYLQDIDERDRKDNWERTFGRPEKFD